LALSSGTIKLVVVAVIAVIAVGALFVSSEASKDGFSLNPFTQKYDITVENGIGGSASGGGRYSEGSTATLTATPSTGYSFVGWYENGQLYSSDPTLRITVDSPHTFTSTFQKKTFVVSVTQNYGSAGTVSGGGSILYEDTTTLNATVNKGYSFSGWYDGTTLLSTSPSYIYTVIKAVTITAAYSIIHDASFTADQSATYAPCTLTITSTYNVEVSYRSWILSDALSGKTLSSYGSYGNGNGTINYSVSSGEAVKITQTVTYSDGQQATSSYVKVVDQIISKHFSWRYQSNAWYSSITNLFGMINGSSASWDVPLSFANYYNAVTSTLPRSNGYSMISSYVTYNNPEIRSMAQGLMSYTSGWSSIDRLNFVLKFVQSIPYKYDIDSEGVEDYWKLPAETLWENNGDCEDHAFLFAALAKAMGYNVVLYYVYCYSSSGQYIDTSGKRFDAHLAAGVDVSGCSGFSTTINGVKYYYCEATATQSAGWLDYADVGYQPSGYVIQNTYLV